MGLMDYETLEEDVKVCKACKGRRNRLLVVSESLIPLDKIPGFTKNTYRDKNVSLVSLTGIIHIQCDSCGNTWKPRVVIRGEVSE